MLFWKTQTKCKEQFNCCQIKSKQKLKIVHHLPDYGVGTPKIQQDSDGGGGGGV